ncbi:uL15 family ribosomal protein [Candidatus Woesearchaeota archaeon]|nr:uL15 family ribosomal protein [Candidatus Woesearchaeota archaeon]
MVVNKRSKKSRQRGSHTHGWGAMKKHRGAGNRGGRGMAGTGKRGDAKKPSIWKDKDYFGRHGFKQKNQEKISAINIAFIEEKFQKLLAGGIVKEVDGSFMINLADMKCNKLLGVGMPTRRYRISAKYASRSAVEKIGSAGGEVQLPVRKEAPAEPVQAE